MRLEHITDALRKRMRPEDKKRLGKAGMTSEEAQEACLTRSEKELQESIASLLRLRKIAFYRSRMDRKTTGTLGWPDITCAIQGRAVAFEAKFGKNDLDPEQVKCITLMRENGWEVYVVRSLAEVKDVLDKHSAICHAPSVP